MYSVEAEFIGKVVQEYGPCAYVPRRCFHGTHMSLFQATKLGAIVAGQTSVKAPEQEAFEAYLPEDVHILSCHSLHGPTVNPRGQPLVSYPGSFCLVCFLFELGSLFCCQTITCVLFTPV